MLAFVGCNHDDEPATVDGISMTIAATRANGQGEIANPTSDIEKIQSWWMVFTDLQGTIIDIAERDASKTTAVEEETCTLQLRPGDYMVYAFANITRQQLQQATNLQFAIGESISGIESALYNNFPIIWKSDDGSVAPLPMSGKQKIKVTTQVNQSFSVEVIRMVAKVEFVFNNDSESDIEVLGVDFGPQFANPLPLFAADDLPLSAPQIPESWTMLTAHYDFPTSDTRTLPTTNPSATYSPYFYMRESSALNHPTGHFYIAVHIRRSDMPEETLYALTSDIQWLNRNDWLRIPVTFTDWSLECAVTFYPPIGGYPAVIVEEKNHEYHVTFSSGGNFAIYPTIRRGATGEVVGPQNVTINCTVESDPNHILARQPSYNNTTHELLGELRDGSSTETVAGTAIVKLEIRVNQDNNPSHLFQRRIYIVKQ